MSRILQVLGYQKVVEARIEVDASLRHIEECWFVWWVHPVLPSLRASAN